MKILTLIIKQKFFDQIISGEKKQEFREIKPSTEKRLVQLDKDNIEITDENGNSIPVEYDAIRFYVGYNKNRDSALVKVDSAYTEIFVDDNGEIIDYEYNGDYYIAQQVVYNLGEVLECDTHEK